MKLIPEQKEMKIVLRYFFSSVNLYLSLLVRIIGEPSFGSLNRNRGARLSNHFVYLKLKMMVLGDIDSNRTKKRDLNINNRK